MARSVTAELDASDFYRRAAPGRDAEAHWQADPGRIASVRLRRPPGRVGYCSSWGRSADGI